MLEVFLSLFTTRDRSEAIAGDLTEERHVHGAAWFWCHAVRTTCALFTQAFARAPVAVLALAALGFVLLVPSVFVGSAAVLLFPVLSSVVRWILLSLFWWAAAWWTGTTLVTMAPRHGMTACLTLAITGEALLGVLGIVYTSALFAAAPLVAGGAIVRWRTQSRLTRSS